MTKHNVGDLLLFTEHPYMDTYQFGIIIAINENAYMPYTVKWIDGVEHTFASHFSGREIRRFKMNYNRFFKRLK